MHSNPSSLPPIIAIDDSDDDLFFLRRLLALAAPKRPLICFTDAADAIAYLTGVVQSEALDKIPLLVITDVKMPGVSGFQFVEWMRDQKDLSRRPVFMLSTSDDPKDMTRAAELGAEGYLIKFPSAEKMEELIRSIT